MPERRIRFVVETGGSRVDRLVADASGRGRRAVRDWLTGGRVRVDGRMAAASVRVAAGSVVDVEIPGTTEAPPVPDVLILLETAAVVALAKPAGIHSERGKSPGSVADFLEQRYADTAEIGDRGAEAGLLHRLDQDTSGVVLAARSREAWLALRESFREGRARKLYLALVEGRLSRPAVLDSPLARRSGRMALASRHDDALPARTRVEPLERGRDWSLVAATMSTGVMHQVRVHLAGIGHPLLGDRLYGGRPAPPSRSGHLLHAMRVRLEGAIDCSSAVPGDFLAALAELRRDRA